jgi:hypothetical protein
VDLTVGVMAEENGREMEKKVLKVKWPGPSKTLGQAQPSYCMYKLQYGAIFAHPLFPAQLSGKYPTTSILVLANGARHEIK